MTHKTHPAFPHVRKILLAAASVESWRKLGLLARSEESRSSLIIPCILWLVATVEIIQRIGGQTPDPRFWMLIAALITAYSLLLVPRRRSSPADLSTRNTSPAFDKMINRIVSSGLTVYHQPVREHGHDGYVMVGPAGVYTMEVKTGNAFGSRTIDCRKGNELVLGGRICDRQPVKQARAAAQQLRRRLEDVLGGQRAVKPLVVFLDEWQINQPEPQQEVAVLNANQLDEFLKRQEPVLSQSKVAEISELLDDREFAAAC